MDEKKIFIAKKQKNADKPQKTKNKSSFGFQWYATIFVFFLE